ncbi:MAG: helix-turn-helix transcriptional regulator [Spirochaetaceae bacterium]|jgi:putative molybdopterin biosynthesis protein|nr:helix-turn-helix transcriptional regulator [Spirochaetaceae bacterium]
MYYNAIMSIALLTAEEAAAQLKIKKYTVYELIKRGELPSSRVGKQVCISQSDLDAYLESGKVNARPAGGFGERSGAVSEGPLRAEPSYVIGPAGAVPAAAQTIISGQDSCIDLLTARISAAGDPVLRSYMGCYNALIALYNGRITMAGVHLWDRESGVYNYPFIRRLVPGVPLGVLRLAGRMQGFYVREGNPLKVRHWTDLARQDLTMINRERGCGTRILLDQKLAELGINTRMIRGYSRESTSHMACASIVARGGADLGIGCERGADHIPGLEFIPLQSECYDLVFPLSSRKIIAVEEVCSYVASGEFRRELEMLGGYDTSETGRYLEL